MAVVDFRNRAMASDVHIVAVDVPAGAVKAATQLLAELEGLWNRFVPTSRLQRNSDAVA